MDNLMIYFILFFLQYVFVFAKINSFFTINPKISHNKLLKFNKNLGFIRNNNDEKTGNLFEGLNSDDNDVANNKHVESDYNVQEDDTHQKHNTNDGNDREQAKNLIDEIKANEHINDMKKDADEMIKLSKAESDKAHDVVNDVSDNKIDNTYSNKQVIPKGKDSGNIVITNYTHTPQQHKQDEEVKIDPLQAIRDATFSLYQRAKQKNLPVDDPSDLSTPEKIYASLNNLEFTIDGYRFNKIEVPNGDSDKGNNELNEANSNIDENEGSDDMDNNVEDPRFVQVKDDDLSDDEQGDDDYDNEDETYLDNESIKDTTHEESVNSSNKLVSPEKAMEEIKNNIFDLLTVLNTVVESNTGVKNVIVHDNRHAIHEQL